MKHHQCHRSNKLNLFQSFIETEISFVHIVPNADLDLREANYIYINMYFFSLSLQSRQQSLTPHDIMH